MSKSVDLSHLVFVDLLRNLVDTTGVKVAKGNLMRIAMNTGDNVEAKDFPSFDAFVEALDKGETPLANLEGRAVHIGDGVFGLEHCPFGELAGSYKEFFSSEPTGFKEITEEFNAESRMAKELNVGQGAGVGPFCIFHQPMRSQAAAKITIAGEPIEIIQLACKSGKGDKAYAESLISGFGCEKSKVETVVDNHMCCYGIRMKDGSAVC